jgi:hypothetical protein
LLLGCRGSRHVSRKNSTTWLWSQDILCGNWAWLVEIDDTVLFCARVKEEDVSGELFDGHIMPGKLPNRAQGPAALLRINVGVTDRLVILCEEVSLVRRGLHRIRNAIVGRVDDATRRVVWSSGSAHLLRGGLSERRSDYGRLSAPCLTAIWLRVHNTRRIAVAALAERLTVRIGFGGTACIRRAGSGPQSWGRHEVDIAVRGVCEAAHPIVDRCPSPLNIRLAVA